MKDASDIVMDVTFVAFIFSAIVLMAAASWAFYRESQLPSFSLQKASWTCTASHTESSGKSFMTVCDQYSRISHD